ncbi:GNAT family N-acetyltransferase [Halobacillus sp. A5]|uniref:GNAT family N-acetyltransferase n=1 Tax=Halobacillus sp. A5 TaxID=2880263 RepID=UPI0020A6ACCB|nr:GNAT family N-acetyltransferase [Halobacillus sp. A5]MCP3026416.1 GNAT family N-acetyltransferase [Halobacillus sp. A5]
MILTSNRIYMRPYETKDEDFLYSMLANREVVQYIGDGRIKNQDEKTKFMEWIYHTYMKDPRLGLHVLVRKADNLRVGHAGLVQQIIDQVEELEVGYWIDRPFWGMGYATEAASALVEYGWFELKKSRLISLIQTDNNNSRNVAKKVGMVKENVRKMGERDVEIYSITRKKEME